MAAFPQKLGIIAGGGILPARLIQFCDANHIKIFIAAFEGHADPAILSARDHMITRPGAAGSIIQTLRAWGFRDLVMIGSLKRPKLSQMRPDLKTIGFFAKLGFKALGDDGLLKAVRAELEADGFIIHGIQDFMPELLMPFGTLGDVVPSEEQWRDIRLGLSASRKIGEADIGQSVIVCGGVVTGTENECGTNALIKRAAKPGAILVKSAKPQQDRKLDMPTIGSDTLKLCAALGYAGIAAEARGVIIADREEMMAEANKSGLFVVGV
jgi:hypothetical protein